MIALYAGLLAWGIEISIAFIIMVILKHEERKVINKRKNK
jgi:hypothetical protein